MKHNDRICHRVIISNNKQRQSYIKREQNHIENTPKIILGKLQNNIQQIWTEELIHQPVQLLKELTLCHQTLSYARTIIVACKRLALRYGYFMINENMIFLNHQSQIIVWINPVILQNKVKIYLPNTHEGEAIMIRSIITYLRLWLKCDYKFLGEAKNLDELLANFDFLYKKIDNSNLKPPVNPYSLVHKNSMSHLDQPNFTRYSANGLKVPEASPFIQQRSNRDIFLNSPSQKQELLFKSMSTKHKGLLKQTNHETAFSKQEQGKNKTSLSRNTDQLSQKNMQSVDAELDRKSVSSIHHATKLTVNKSQGIRSGSNYFPNRTTSNKNHPIVQLINSQDTVEGEYKQNKILIEQDSQADRETKKQSDILDGIGQQVNELFFSNMESDQNKEEIIMKIEEEFGNLLN